MVCQYKNQKSTDWQVFHWADSQTSRYGIVKNVSLSIRLPSLQMEVSTTFDVFYCQEEIEFSKISVVCSAPFVLVANWRLFSFYRRFPESWYFVIGRLFPVPVSVGKSFLWCSVLKTDRLKMFTTWYKKTGWSRKGYLASSFCLLLVHTFCRWMSQVGKMVSQVSSRTFLWIVYRSLCLYDIFFYFPRNRWYMSLRVFFFHLSADRIF